MVIIFLNIACNWPLPNLCINQSDLVNTKESVLPVHDKHYHMNKRSVQKEEVIEVLRNYALVQKYEDTIMCYQS